jgi:hypothetical protein
MSEQLQDRGQCQACFDDGNQNELQCERQAEVGDVETNSSYCFRCAELNTKIFGTGIEVQA